MRKVVALSAIVGAMVVPVAGFGGNGGGLSAHLARLDAKVERYAQKCHVDNPAAKCAARKAKLAAKLTRFEAKLDARIARSHNATRTAALQSARDHIASLLASL